MRTLIILLISGSLIILSSCGAGEQAESTSASTVKSDSTHTTETTKPDPVPSETPEPADTTIYANQRFRKVQVKELGDNKYHITGQGQIFEASFGWVVEDGHNELKTGHETTSMGAPEWGDFSFNVEASPKRPNSVLHLILFETSAKDGSRQHELAIPLK